MKPASLLLAAWLILACGDTTPSKKNSAPSLGNEAVLAKKVPAAIEAPSVALADSPSINLVDNRYLWHVFRDGLLLPMASEGFRKYNHEYSRPWTKIVKHQGEAGRVLAKRQSVVRFGWFDDASTATLRMRVHGLVVGQRASIQLNGVALGNVTLEASWQDVEIRIPSDRLRTGEN